MHIDIGMFAMCIMFIVKVKRCFPTISSAMKRSSGLDRKCPMKSLCVGVAS